MDEEKKKTFINELEGGINGRKRIENVYKFVRVLLMVIIAVCGFLTASYSQDPNVPNWVSSWLSLFSIGLISTVSAILNQALAPSEKAIFHKNVKKALQNIRNLVEFGGLELGNATRLQNLATTDPDKALEEINKIVPKSNSGQ